MTLPITLIGGYLGSGKTTLVNHLLRHADGLRLAILVNEFGELPIDHDLIESQDENVISIAGGCVCCSYGNDLTLAMMDLLKMDPPPEHVLLEASGVALPAAIAASLSLLQDYTVDGIVILANAETIREQAVNTYIGDTVLRQLQCADLLVLNKTDLLQAADRLATETWLREQVPDGELVCASYATLPPALVLQSFLGKAPSVGDSALHHSHLFTTLSLPMSAPVNAQWLAECLSQRGLGLVRAKGFVRDTAGETNTIQVVGRRWAVSAAPADVKPGLVVIGHTDLIDTAAIKQLLSDSSHH